MFDIDSLMRFGKETKDLEAHEREILKVILYRELKNDDEMGEKTNERKLSGKEAPSYIWFLWMGFFLFGVVFGVLIAYPFDEIEVGTFVLIVMSFGVEMLIFELLFQKLFEREDSKVDAKESMSGVFEFMNHFLLVAKAKTDEELMKSGAKDLSYLVRNRTSFPDEYREALKVFERSLIKSLDEVRAKIMKELFFTLGGTN